MTSNLRERQAWRGSEEEHNGRLHPPKSMNTERSRNVDVTGVIDRLIANQNSASNQFFYLFFCRLGIPPLPCVLYRLPFPPSAREKHEPNKERKRAKCRITLLACCRFSRTTNPTRTSWAHKRLGLSPSMCGVGKAILRRRD